MNGSVALTCVPNLIESRSEGGPFFSGLIFGLRDVLGLTSNNIQYCASNSTIMMAVQAGMGFAFLPSQMNFGLCPDNVVKLPLNIPEASIKRALGWNSSNKNIAAMQFVEIVREMVGG